MKQTKTPIRLFSGRIFHSLKTRVLILPLVFLLSSCIGANLDIVLNQDGSGLITLEYQISKSLDSLGKLDGNERWGTIPVGEADFERTMDRLPEMKLLSFSSKDDGKNIIIDAKMQFSSLKGLLAFLDATGRRSTLSVNAGSGRLLLTLSEGAEKTDANLNRLLAAISENYSIRMSMTFPGEGSLALTDNKGNPLKTTPGVEIQPAGKKVSCSFPLYDVITSADGINVEFRW